MGIIKKQLDVETQSMSQERADAAEYQAVETALDLVNMLVEKLQLALPNDSVATTVEELVEDYNKLLSTLRSL